MSRKMKNFVSTGIKTAPMVVLILIAVTVIPAADMFGATSWSSSTGCYETSDGCVSFKHILDEVACGDRFTDGDESARSIGFYEAFLETDSSTIRNWMYESENRGYTDITGIIFTDAEITRKYYDHMYGLNASYCRTVLEDAGIPLSEFDFNKTGQGGTHG